MNYIISPLALSKLKTGNGEAPHKPLLLLTVLKAAERDGDLPDVLPLSPELAYQFKLFEHIVGKRPANSILFV